MNEEVGVDVVVEEETTDIEVKSDVLKGEPGVNGKDGKDGKDGVNGKDGNNGNDGKSAYEIWLEQGNEGTEEDFIASLKGEQGEKPVLGTDYFTETDKQEIIEELTQDIEEAKNDFNSNATSKLEEYNLNAENKLNEFNENASSYEERIETLESENVELKAKDIELEAENERLREDLNNTIPSISGESENVTLNGTANARFKKFGIGGNSWQETRSGKNLFNALNITNPNITVNNNGQEIVMPIITSGNGITGTGRTLSQLCPNLKVGDVVYLYFNTNSNYNTLIYLHGTSESWRINTSKTITEEMLSGNVSLYGNRYQDGETDQVTISNFMITKVNDNTWEQYGAMPSTEFKSDIQNVTGNANVTICNKNLFNINALSTDYFDINGNEFKAKDNISPNKKYYWYNNIHYSGNITFKWKYKAYDTSQSSSTRGLVFRIYKTDETYVELSSYVNSNDEKQVTVDNVDYAYTTYGNFQNNTIYDFEIVVGSTATTYTEHQEQSFTFPLAEGQKLMLNDYLADDRIHHKRKQIVLTGEEDGWIWADTTRYALKIDNAKNGNGLCNQFKYNEYSATVKIDNTFNIVNGYLGFYITSITSLTAFKNYLAEQYANGTPVVVEYDLAEEEIESYTEEQQAVYNEIKKTAHSYGEQTHIFSTDETSPIFDVEALADIQTIFNNLQAQILAGEV